MDVDTIQPGENFVDAIENAVSSCDVLIALIGAEWLTIPDDEGNRRLDNPNDFVRVEISTALKRDIRVIPVLLSGTEMPNARDLPEDLQLLTKLNALEIRHGSFDPGIEKLESAIDSCLREVRASQETFMRRIPVWIWIAAVGSIFVIGIFIWQVFRSSAMEVTTPSTEAVSPVAANLPSGSSPTPSSTPTSEIQATEIRPIAVDAIVDNPTPEPSATVTDPPPTITPVPTEMPIVDLIDSTPVLTATLDLPYGNLILGPVSSSLEHDPYNNNLKMSKMYYKDENGMNGAVIGLQDFIIEAVFYNPYGSETGFWDFGFMFRDTTQNGMPEEQGFSQARIVISNEIYSSEQGKIAIDGQGYWWFYDNPSGTRNILYEALLTNLDTSAGGANRLTLMAKGPDGEVYLNGTLIGKLDLSGRNHSGRVWVAAGFKYGHEIAGATTRVEDIRIWDIKPEP